MTMSRIKQRIPLRIVYGLGQMQSNESWSRKQLLPAHLWTSCLERTRSWEDDSKRRNVTSRDLLSLSHPFHIVVTSIKSSSLHLFLQLIFPFVFTFFLRWPCLPLSAAQRAAEAVGLRRRVHWGMQGPAPGLDQSALQWFLLFRVCVFPEKLLVCRLLPVLFLNTHRCILDVNLYESSVLADSQSHHWASELWIPK